jgi:hypothetical protein
MTWTERKPTRSDLRNYLMYKPALQEINMTTSTNKHSNLFYGAIAGVAVIAPIGLVAAAGTMPEGPETGQFIVSSFGAVFAVIVAALAVRAAYSLGFSKA